MRIIIVDGKDFKIGSDSRKNLFFSSGFSSSFIIRHIFWNVLFKIKD